MRAQCRSCYEAGLSPSYSISVCPECEDRAIRRREELDQLAAFVATLDQSPA